MLELYNDIYIPLICELESTCKGALYLLTSYSFRIRSTDLCEQERKSIVRKKHYGLC